MNRAEYEAYVSDFYGVTADHPFADDPEIAVFRHSGNRKWFAVLMPVKMEKLGLTGQGSVEVVNLKCGEDIVYSMLSESGIHPAYHMNKRHWLTLRLDGSADDETLEWLTEISHSLTATKIKPAKRKKD